MYTYYNQYLLNKKQTDNAQLNAEALPWQIKKGHPSQAALLLVK